MKIEYIKEILNYYELDYNLIYQDEITESDENKNEIIIENKSDVYEITEFLTENFISHDIISESYDSVTIRLNIKENKSEIKSINDYMIYIHELKLYDELLNSDHEYKKAFEYVGMNKISDASYKFYLNHKNFITYELDENNTDAYELFSELISESELYNELNYILYMNLDELIESYDPDEFYSIFRNYNFIISDESNILIDRNKHQIRNINESDYKTLLKYAIKSNFFYNDSEIDENKTDEFIELINAFDEYNSYEIYSNNEMNLKYMHNKLLISFDSFKYYSNQDEYILINKSKSDENKSINKSDIISDSNKYLDALIDASIYYAFDSYEYDEFLRILKILSWINRIWYYGIWFN